MDAIAAVSTPRAAGGISVIRISGRDALKAADMVFTPISDKKIPSDMKGYTCAYGYYTDENGERIDDGIVTVFKAPHSYTGEDIAELSCHGGIYVTERLLERIYKCGISPAQAGEFTKRAFLNGKMSLTQAEAVADIISADGEAYRRSAVLMREGALFGRITSVSEMLLHLLGDIAAWVDYPEDDIPEVTDDNLLSSLTDIYNELNNIASTYNYGKIIREGIDTVIAGKPNVGKSTLMNLLAGCERSIVTDIAGTTRDIVEESVRLGDIVLKLSDTAGIHSTEDIIEGIGVERAKSRITSAKLVLAVFDNSMPADDDDRQLIEICKGAPNVIAVINKSDKPNLLNEKYITDNFRNTVSMSAESGEGTQKLKDILYDMFIKENIALDGAVIANERQKNCIDKATGCIYEAISAVKSSVTLDAVEIILDEAENSLLELTGERTSEAVVNEVFSHFCVGK